MDENQGANNPQANELRFALVLTKVFNSDGTAGIGVETRNQGIPDPEVFLFVESWLEKAKDQAKDQIKDGIVFWQGDDEPTRR